MIPVRDCGSSCLTAVRNNCEIYGVLNRSHTGRQRADETKQYIEQNTVPGGGDSSDAVQDIDGGACFCG